MNTVIGEKIKRQRKSMRISQEGLGAYIKLHQTAVCRVERGIQSLTPEQLWKTCKMLKLRVGFLLSVADRAGKMHRKKKSPDTEV